MSPKFRKDFFKSIEAEANIQKEKSREESLAENNFKLILSYEKLERELKEVQDLRQKEYTQMQKKIGELEHRNEILSNALQQLREQQSMSHNERGAGRKQICSRAQKRTAKILYEEGKPVPAIAEEMGCSKSTIYRALKEFQN